MCLSSPLGTHLGCQGSQAWFHGSEFSLALCHQPTGHRDLLRLPAQRNLSHSLRLQSLSPAACCRRPQVKGATGLWEGSSLLCAHSQNTPLWLQGHFSLPHPPIPHLFFPLPQALISIKGMGRPGRGGLAAIVGEEVFSAKLPFSLSSWMGVEELRK